MRIDLGSKRRNEIKLAVLDVLEQYSNVKLPVPIKKVVKFLGYRLVPYSTFSQKHNLTYQETVSYFGTDDACSDYEKNTDVYVIYFNDMDKTKIENNRVRWNIAHELGHIVLGHHKGEKTRLFRNSLNSAEYNRFEEEADAFASYILVPYVILKYQDIKKPEDIARICRISKSAAKYRFLDFRKWKFYIDINISQIEKYDIKIFRLYNSSQANQNNIFCTRCGNLTGYKSIKYCYICGNKKKVYKKEGKMMIYDGIELDNNKRVKICPICQNEELGTEDIFCKICGTKLYNECTQAMDPDLPFENTCQQGGKLDGNARFCPYCGSYSLFLQNGILRKWEDSSYLSTDEEIPF